MNTRLLLHGRLEGIGRFTYETLSRIVQNHPEHRFFFIFDRPFHQEFVFSDNVTPIVVGPVTRHPVLWYWWFENSLPRVLKKIKADIFLSPDGYCSLKTKVPTALVIHDIAFEHYPEHIPLFTRKYLLHYSRKFAHKATCLATVSEFSKQDIIKQYGISADKISVVPNGVSEFFGPFDENQKQAIRQQYTDGQAYFLYVGSLHPRKNVQRLLQAFDQFKTDTDSPVKLVLAGAKGWKVGETEQAFNQTRHQKEVIFTGHLEKEALAQLTASAMAMVYVSVFEGFGIPIIEAMKSEVPVITSNISSMPEVAGEAALLVDPHSIASIADGMSKVSGDEKLRQNLVEKGKERVRFFSWDASAQKLWKVLEPLTLSSPGDT